MLLPRQWLSQVSGKGVGGEVQDNAGLGKEKMKPPEEIKLRSQAWNAVIPAAAGAGRLGVRLFSFFFLKLNTILWWTERLWLFDFLPAWEMLPACRVCALTFAEGQAAGQTLYGTRASQDFGPRLIFHTAGPEQGPQGAVAWSCLGFFL